LRSTTKNNEKELKIEIDVVQNWLYKLLQKEMNEKLSPTITSKSPLSFTSHKMGPSLAIWAHSETIFF
jgi:hypothetical protein